MLIFKHLPQNLLCSTRCLASKKKLQDIGKVKNKQSLKVQMIRTSLEYDWDAETDEEFKITMNNTF